MTNARMQARVKGEQTLRLNLKFPEHQQSQGQAIKAL